MESCESAYLYGYVPGQSISIRTAIKKIMGNNEEKSPEKTALILAIDDAFIGVVQILLNNKFKKDPLSFDDVRTLTSESVNNKSAIDINNMDKENAVLNSDVINSCMTDIEVLKAASSIIGLLLGSNQLISL